MKPRALHLLVAVVVAFNGFAFKHTAPMTPEDYAEQIGIEESELLFMAGVVEAESDRNPEHTEGRVLIALTIINRVDDGRFGGDTIEEVLNARGQFSTVRNGHAVVEASDESILAVVEAYEWHETGEAPNVLFFNCRGYNYGEPYGYIDGNYFMTLEVEE